MDGPAADFAPGAFSIITLESTRLAPTGSKQPKFQTTSNPWWCIECGADLWSLSRLEIDFAVALPNPMTENRLKQAVDYSLPEIKKKKKRTLGPALGSA